MVTKVLLQQMKAKFIQHCALDGRIRFSKKPKPQSKFLNPYVDSQAIPFSTNLSLFPKCQGALEERPGACAPSTRMRVLPHLPTSKCRPSTTQTASCAYQAWEDSWILTWFQSYVRCCFGFHVEKPNGIFFFLSQKQDSMKESKDDRIMGPN